MVPTSLIVSPLAGYNIMENNWEYRPYHLIYSHSCGNAIYLGDLSAASNLNFLHSQRIVTGSSKRTQW
jgi:hypothetical protein